MAGVTVVVPSWNRRDLLMRVSEGLRRQTYPVDELIVVDNGSEDGSTSIAAEQGAKVISIGRNSGFCHAVNTGIREAKGPWVAVVNNDVEPAPDWLSRLMEGAEHEKAWFATGKLLSASRRDQIDGAYDTLCRGGCAWRAGHGRPDGPEWGIRRTIRFAPFTAVLFRTELFKRVGLLDERFESYLEDVDFGLRCAIKDMKGVYVPDAVASTPVAQPLGPGTGTPSGTLRAIRSSSWPSTIRTGRFCATPGPFLWRKPCGAVSPSVTARASHMCGARSGPFESCRACERLYRSRRAAPRRAWTRFLKRASASCSDSSGARVSTCIGGSILR